MYKQSRRRGLERKSETCAYSELGSTMAAIDLIITARLTDPPIGRFSRSIGWFALTSDPDVFMDPSGGGPGYPSALGKPKHLSLCRLNCTGTKKGRSLSACIRARVDTFHLAPADTCICC